MPVQLQPAITFTPVHNKFEDNHAQKLKMRLQLALFKIKTNQTELPLSKLSKASGIKKPTKSVLSAASSPKSRLWTSATHKRTSTVPNISIPDDLLGTSSPLSHIEIERKPRELHALPTLSDFSEYKITKESIKSKQFNLTQAIQRLSKMTTKHIQKIDPDSTMLSNTSADSLTIPIETFTHSSYDTSPNKTPTSIGAARSLLQLALLSKST